MENKIIEGKLLNVKAITALIFATIMVVVNGIWFKMFYDQNVSRCWFWEWDEDWVVEEYGENANVMPVTIHDYRVPFLLVLAVSIVIALLFFLRFHKIELVVTDKRVYGKTSFGKRVDLPLDSISAVGISLMKTIAVTTASGAIKFGLIANSGEVHDKITSLLVKRQGQEKQLKITEEKPVNSNLDDLRTIKDLLDLGIITQEEFDKKKRQILDL